MRETSFSEMYIIVAMTHDRVIGDNNRIPWHIPDDLKTFKRITSGSVVIMGRKTFESIGKPLPNRHNFIISKTLTSVEGAEVFGGVEEAVERAIQLNKKIFFIGGAEVYEKALEIVNYMYISWVYGDYRGDTKFPKFDKSTWSLVEEHKFEEFCLSLYRRT